MRTLSKSTSQISSWLGRELIYGGHYTALSSPTIILTLAMVLNLNLRVIDLVVVYLIPLLVYSYDYQADLEKDHSCDQKKVKFLSGKKNYSGTNTSSL